MKKSELFDQILAKTCEICEVRVDDVLNGSKLQAVVDARYLAVQYMRRVGLSNNDISLILFRKDCDDPMACPSMTDLRQRAKSVQRMFDSYGQRCFDSKAFRLMSIDLHKWCNEQFETLEAEGRAAATKMST